MDLQSYSEKSYKMKNRRKMRWLNLLIVTYFKKGVQRCCLVKMLANYTDKALLPDDILKIVWWMYSLCVGLIIYI